MGNPDVFIRPTPHGERCGQAAYCYTPPRALASYEGGAPSLRHVHWRAEDELVVRTVGVLGLAVEPRHAHEMRRVPAPRDGRASVELHNRLAASPQLVGPLRPPREVTEGRGIHPLG